MFLIAINVIYFIVPEQCPATHQYAYLGGKYCCQDYLEKNDAFLGESCDGGLISLTSSCCKDDAHIMCPSGLCKHRKGR